MIRNGQIGGYKVLGLILGLAVAFFAVGVTAASAQCVNDPFRSDEFQCEQQRPIELGVSGSSREHIIDGAFAFCYTGTLGSLVQDANGQYILSNNHVLAKENDPDNGLAPDGREIIQPGLLDEGACSLSLGKPENVVAYLTDYEEILFGRGRNRPDNSIDAAIAKVEAEKVDDTGIIHDVGVLTSGSAPANSLNMLVQKGGRTTGHTFGEVTATNVTINVRYNSGTARFVDQIEVVGLCDSDFSAGGDSGSLIVTLPDGTGPRAPVGLLFAGGGTSTFANSIGNVLSNFGVTMVNDAAGGNPNDVSTHAAIIPTCTPVGSNLQASDDSYNLPKKSTTLIVNAPGVLENDTGYVAGSAILVPGFGRDFGTVVLNGDGGFTYTYLGDDRNGDGTDSFEYEITDGTTTAMAIVTINLASKGGGRPPRSANGPAAVGLELARQIKADHEDELFEIPGVQGSGLGRDASGAPVIRVYVGSAAQSADRPIPADIEGIPVQIVVTGTIEAR